MSNRQPAVFLGHGNPLNAVQSNRYSRAWRALGERLPRPRAVLSVSAHWYEPGAAVTIVEAPRTIHDFRGFPESLFQVQYPAPGDPALAARVRELLAPVEVAADDDWGLDHGTWAVLCHVYPEADVPVVQLRIDSAQPASFHYALGRSLAPLRDDGVLVLGSGNVVHNLGRYDWSGERDTAFDWALRFEEQARELIAGHDHRPLVDYFRLGPDAAMSIPTPEHYLPLLYVLGASDSSDSVSFPVDGIEGGSVSMLSVVLGSDVAG